MKILGAYLGDGSTRIKKVYRGEDLLYENTVEPELYIASAYDRYGVDSCGYIPVLDKGELYTDYKYEIDCVIPARPYGYPNAFIGGSWNIGSSYPSYPDDTPSNLIIASTRFDRYDSDNGYVTGYVTTNLGYGSSWTSDRMFGANIISNYDTRQVFTVVNRNYNPPSGPSGDTRRGTSGGFFLMNSKDYRTADTPMYRTGMCTDNASKVYRISVYDQSDNLIMNFIPKIMNNHKGMLETVSNTFYPCNDDSKFVVQADEPLVRGRRSTPNVFNGKTKMYFGAQEIPKMQIQDKYFWNKFDYDIQKFDVVEEED